MRGNTRMAELVSLVEAGKVRSAEALALRLSTVKGKWAFPNAMGVVEAAVAGARTRGAIKNHIRKAYKAAR